MQLLGLEVGKKSKQMVISEAWDKYYVLTIYYLQIGSNGSPVIYIAQFPL